MTFPRLSSLCLAVALLAGCHKPASISCPGAQRSCNGVCMDVLSDGGACYAEIEADAATITAVRARLGLDIAPVETRSYFEIVRLARGE